MQSKGMCWHFEWWVFFSSFPFPFLIPPPPSPTLRRLFFLLWCLCGACHTPTPQQRRLLLASSSVSSVSKFSRAVTHPAPAPTSPARRTTTVRWWRWPSRKPSRPTYPTVTAPTAASTAERTWPTMMSSSQRWVNGFRGPGTQTDKGSSVVGFFFTLGSNQNRKEREMRWISDFYLKQRSHTLGTSSTERPNTQSMMSSCPLVLNYSRSFPAPQSWFINP